MNKKINIFSIIQEKSKPLLLSRGRCNKDNVFFPVSKNLDKPTLLGVGRNKDFLIMIYLIIISIVLVSAQYNPTSQEDLNKYLNELREKGILNTELINNIEKLHYSQKEQIITSIKSDSKEFWSQWKTEINEQQKRALLKEVSLEKRNEFMQKYGKHYEVDFVNLGDENILFGKENTIGNNGAYFQMDMIESYNKKNSNNKIVSVKYKRNSLIFKYEKGNSLELSTEGETINGFYFNPDSGYLGKVGKDGIVDKNNPLTGHWNGKGSLKLSTNEKGTNINFDFNKNAKGKAENPVDYAKFTNLKKESYSVFQDPIGKDDKGNTKYDLKPGELNFDSDGKLTKMSNMYKNPEINKDTKSWGGFFGKDTSVVYTEDEFKSAKGSKILVDLEKGQIKSEVNKIEEGVAVDVKNVISRIQKKIEDFKKRLDENSDKILKDIDKSQGEINEALDKAEANRGKLFGEAKLAYAQLKIREGITKDLGLGPQAVDSKLVKALSKKDGLFIIKNTLRYTSNFLGAAGDLSNTLLGGIDKINNPFLKSLNPSPDSRMNIQLNNPTAVQLKNIEMYDGSLEIADSYGNLVSVVKRATSYGYILPSTLNKGNNYFDKINFNLNNENFENKNGEKGQTIQIFSDNGMLNVIGTGLKDLKTVDGEYVVDAGGEVSWNYKAFFGLIKGGGSKREYGNVLTADYKTSSDARTNAINFFNNANKDYKILYDRYSSNGWTKQETEELTKIYNNNFVRYNQILNSGDIELSISSSRLNKILNSFSASGSLENNPIINQIELDTFNNDPILQKQLAERGIIGKSEIKSFVSREIVNINNFIKSNAGTNLQFVKDSSNGIYQIRTNGAVYNIDSSAGPFISSTLPVIISHGGIDSKGNFYLDKINSRFGNTIGIYVEGGHYEGVKASKQLQKNAASIEYGIANTVQEIVKQKLMDPRSKGYQTYQIYSPTY